MSRVRIVVDDLSDEAVRDLVALHLTGMRALTPEEHVYAFDLTRLQAPDIRFWSVWGGTELLGIGALQVDIAPSEGEVKSMRTHPDHLRAGVGRTLLRHIIGEARAMGLTRLWLETGVGPGYLPAQSLYVSEGFQPCAPFGPYIENPHSCYYTLPLAARPAHEH